MNKVCSKTSVINNVRRSDTSKLDAPVTDLYGLASDNMDEIRRYLDKNFSPRCEMSARTKSFRGVIKGARLKDINFITTKFSQDTELILHAVKYQRVLQAV